MVPCPMWGKETIVKAMVVRETGGKVSEMKATGAQVNQETGGKGDRLMRERDPDNSRPPSDKAAGQNVMEGIHRKSYSEAAKEVVRKKARVFVGDSIVRKTDRVLNKFVITGVCGFRAGSTKTSCPITGFMVMSIISSVFAAISFLLCIFAAVQLDNTNEAVLLFPHRKLLIAVVIVCIIVYFFESIASICSWSLFTTAPPLTGSERVTALPALFTVSVLVTTLGRAGRTAMALHSPSPHPAKAGFLLRWILLLLATAPSLGESDCRSTVGGLDYLGQVNTTVTGRTCKPWSSQHYQGCLKYLPDANTSVAENYCRNPTGSPNCQLSMPWCYTTDSATLREYCDVPLCGYEEPACSRPLGMESGDIKDAQITASSSTHGHEPFKARLNLVSDNGYAGWIAYNRNDQHLRVDLLTLHDVTKLVVQGSGTRYNSWTKQFKVLYSENGLTWKFHKIGAKVKLFEGNPARYHAIAHSFHPPLRTNTYWTLSGSPYVVRREITVIYSASLTIQAGVDVVFVGSQAGLLIEGCIQAQGLAGLEVTFHSNEAASYTGAVSTYWKGLAIQNQERTCSGSTLHNVRVSGAATGIKITTADIELQNIHLYRNLEGLRADRLDTDKPLTIRHSVIENNTNKGLNLKTKCNVSFIGCRFSHNSIGVSVAITGDDLAAVEVVDSEFTHNRQYGFRMNDVSRVSCVTFTNTDFIGCSLYFYDNRRIGTPLNVGLDRCSFSALTNTQQLIMQIYYRAVRMTISNTVFHDTYYGAALLGGRRSSIVLRNVTAERNSYRGFSINTAESFVSVSESTFRDNKNSAVVFSQSNRGTYVGNITLANNEFTGNFGSKVVDINTDTDILLENNMFVNNTAKVTVNYVSPNRGNLRCARNVFENPAADHELQVGPAMCVSCLVDARYNWWGTANTTAIPQRIQDFFLDMDLDEALLSPVLSSSSIDSASHVELTRDFKMDGHTIGGRINENITFLVIDNNLQVRYTIHVPAGKKLVLHLNAPLTFDSYRGILVEGTLELRGNSSRSAVLSSKQKWRGLKFIHSTGSVLEHCNISRATFGVEATGTTSLELSNCVIEDMSRCGIFASLSNLTKTVVQNCTIQRTYQESIYVKTASNKKHTLSLSVINSEINSIKVESDMADVFVERSNITAASTYYGYNLIFVISTTGHIRIDKCRINNTGNRRYSMSFAQFKYYSTHDKRIILSNSSVDGGINVYSSNSRVGNSSFTVSNNMFERSRRGDLQCIFVQGVTSLNVEGNTFSHHTSQWLDIRTSSPDALRLRNNTFVDTKNPLVISLSGIGRNDAVDIEDNVFKDNNGDYVVKIAASSYKGTVIVHDNRFWNNSAGTTMLLGSGYMTSLTRNMFDNPLAQYDVKVTAVYSASSVIYATQNWWGYGQYSDVTSRIYDHSIDSSVARVVFQPYLTARNLTALSRSTRGFFRGSRVIGGKIKQDIYLRKMDKPYVVVDDITIPVGVSLTIEAGTQLKFQQGGIIVEGFLNILGEKDNEVLMAPSDIGWKGISFQQVSEYVRLRGGSSPREGRVEMLLDNDWVSVCTYRWYKVSADVLCRQLGYAGGAQETDTTNRFDAATRKDVTWRSVPCSGQENILQECRPQTYCGGTYQHAGVVCVGKAQQPTETTAFMSAKFTRQMVTYNEVYAVVLGNTSTIFRVLRPGLTNQESTVSVMSLEKPGWFLRHFEGSVYLEPRVNPRGPDTFDMDATFYERENRFFEGYFALESVNAKNAYVVCNSSGALSVEANETTSDFSERASFAIVESDSSTSGNARRRRKRLAG
ncbi:hypothetical protein LSAT2_030698 [Lamellibrachia satsuma]|nr:hypothetical protein LSAT2_030698 [Lamellibrachia satsuma]